MLDWIGLLIGLENAEAIHGASFRFGSAWASERPALLFFGLVILVVFAFLAYRKLELSVWNRRGRWLWIPRALVGMMIFLCLAEPLLTLKIVETPKPILVVLLDQTESMDIEDRLSRDDRDALSDSVNEDLFDVNNPNQRISRQRLMTEVFNHDKEWLTKLNEKYRLRFYVMNDRDRSREILVHEDKDPDGTVDVQQLIEALRIEGELTALGDNLRDVGSRHQGASVSGMIVFSDYQQNSGSPALVAARRMQAPLYTVGLGPKSALDISTHLRMSGMLKEGEKTILYVRVDQSGLEGRQVKLKVTGRYMDQEADEQAEEIEIFSEQEITLEEARREIEIPWTPDRTGAVQITASVQPLEDEALKDNNQIVRDTRVRDDALKVLFIEHEPTWEWRFIKEVFHRDPLVGKEGLRTYLNSADFKVRQENPLFLETIESSRQELFSYDVIMIGDVPREMISPRVADMLEEYVGRFGGGLVVVNGPRFGVNEMVGTPLADMLPVIPDPRLERNDQKYHPQLTAAANEQLFMRLGESPEENLEAWDNMGALPWYQPVRAPHPQAVVLMEHPEERVDERTMQPIIAMRRYGRGQVVYFGVNEMWRLRRLYGEKYYRQLWGQLIYHLGLNRALGARKRFIVSTDREQYRAGDRVRLMVEAYDESFNPMEVDALETRHVRPDAQDEDARPFETPLAREDVIYETTFPVYTAGEHTLRVLDPITDMEVDVSFKVDSVSIERRAAIRDTELQTLLADQTGGRALELWELNQLDQWITPVEYRVFRDRRIALWNTWLTLLLVAGLLIFEWFIRKWSHLR